jgi:hypothetical protein
MHVSMQVPPAQTWLVPHAFPHLPQFFGSFAVLVQLGPQRVFGGAQAESSPATSRAPTSTVPSSPPSPPSPSPALGDSPPFAHAPVHTRATAAIASEPAPMARG